MQITSNANAHLKNTNKQFFKETEDGNDAQDRQ